MGRMVGESKSFVPNIFLERSSKSNIAHGEGGDSDAAGNDFESDYS